MADEQMPPDPFEATPLGMPAVVVHELYLSYIEAGFDHMGALYLAGIHVSTIGRFFLERNAEEEDRDRRERERFAGIEAKLAAFRRDSATGVGKASTPGTVPSGYCESHWLPKVLRGGRPTCLACEMNLPTAVEVEEGAPMPDATEASAALVRCAVCGGPTEPSADGTALVCPNHPPPDDPPPTPPRYGGLGPHNLGGGR